MANADLFNPSAPLKGDNFTYFRAYIARENDIGQSMFGSYDGTVDGYRNLSGDDQIALTNAQNAWIRAHPDSASPIQQQLAQSKPIEALEELTVAEKATQLPGVGEAIDTASELNDKLNPFAFFDSLSKIKWLVIGGVIIYFVGVPLAKAYIGGKAGAK